MAYGNWGAFVYKNNVRQHNREDNTPYKEDERQAGYYQAFFDDGESLGCHHATLGDGEIRLCGYKSTPILYDKGRAVDLLQFYDGEPEIFEDEKYLPDEFELDFTYKNHKISIEKECNRVDLSLYEPSGTFWKSECGYCMGAGWE